MLAPAFAVYILAGAAVAPSHRHFAVLLIGCLSYLVAYSLGDYVPLFEGRLLYSVTPWAIGSTVATLLILNRIKTALVSGRPPVLTEGRTQRYKGTAPFQDSDLDRQTFFGRRDEIRSLQSLVRAEDLVILFGKSGMGKSSLINAGLVEPLRAQHYLPMVVRLADQQTLPALFAGVRHAAQEAGVDLIGVDETDETSAWRFFKQAEFWSGNDDLLHPVLILDQFEELFTLQAPKERRSFIAELAELVSGRLGTDRENREETSRRKAIDSSPPRLKIVISLREDFLANLEELARDIPGILHNRFRLGPLTLEGARAAITRPASLVLEAFETLPFSYREEALSKMISFLAKRRHGAEMLESNEVEPVQLQLICRYLEGEVRARQTSAGGTVEIQISDADLGDVERMEQVLEDFYERIIFSVRPRTKARAVRRLCEKRLISSGGRRLTEDQEEIERRFGISKELLRQLVDARLLRAEPRLGGTLYEVGHDRLVAPILESGKKRTMELRKAAVAAAPLLLALVSTGLVEAQRPPLGETREELEDQLTVKNASAALKAIKQLLEGHDYSPEHLIKKVTTQLPLNPAVLAALDKQPKEWKWKRDDAEKVLKHLEEVGIGNFIKKRNHEGFIEPELRVSNRRLLGALVSVLDAIAESEVEGDDSSPGPGGSLSDRARNTRVKIVKEFYDLTGNRPSSGKTRRNIPIKIQDVPPFFIQSREVTNVQWTQFVQEDLRNLKADQPVVVKDWYEAVAYAAWLSGGSLPTQAQWEAAKAFNPRRFQQDPDSQEWFLDGYEDKIKERGEGILPGLVVAPSFRKSSERPPADSFRVVWAEDPRQATAF